MAPFVRGVLVWVATWCAGCSLAVRGPPAQRPVQLEELDCTQSLAAPTADLAGAGLAGFAAFALNWRCSDRGDADPKCPGSTKTVVAAAVLAGLYGLSGLRGWWVVGRCRDVVDGLRREQLAAERILEPRAAKAAGALPSAAPRASLFSPRELPHGLAHQFCLARQLRLPTLGERLALPPDIEGAPEGTQPLWVWTNKHLEVNDDRAVAVEVRSGATANRDARDPLPTLCLIDWTRAAREAWSAAAGGCADAAREAGARDPLAACACARGEAERLFPGYGAWRGALEQAARGPGRFDLTYGKDPALSTWFRELQRCAAERPAPR